MGEIVGIRGLSLLVLGLLLCVSWPLSVHAADTPFAPGFGVIVGAGVGPQDAEVHKAGFTSRRLEDGGRSGALTLMGESFENGVPIVRLDTSLSKKDVHVEYQAVYVELKRYVPVWGRLNTFWGLRGGTTRLTITEDRGGPKDHTVQANQFAPLWFLTLPLTLENPGFALLALVEGGSVGASFDLVPNHVWLELQVSGAMLPRFRDKFVTIDAPFVITRTLSISAAF